MEVNGKIYPFWGQFVERKNEFVGGCLQDFDMGYSAETTITDITLEPNGETSAFFSVVGADFTCGFDVGFGGISAGAEGWLTFHGYAGHKWRIRPPENKAADEAEARMENAMLHGLDS